MSKMLVLKDIMNEKINTDKVYQNVILAKEKRKFGLKPSYVFISIAALMLINVFVPDRIIEGGYVNFNNAYITEGDIDMYYKEEKVIDSKVLNYIKIPDNFVKKEYNAYVQGKMEMVYDVFHHSIIEYQDNEKVIKIEYSNQNELSRCYYIKNNERISKINNCEILIADINGCYMCEFTYDEYNYMIDAKGINEQELINLLKNIINE